MTHCPIATVIVRRREVDATPFENLTSSEPSVVESSPSVLSRVGSKSLGQTKSTGNADFIDLIDFVGLTFSDQDTPQEDLVLRELVGRELDVR